MAIVTCRICETRKPRRYCPGVRGDICAPCCGAEREVSVHCPLDCEYLLEAREHEKYIPPDRKDFPNRDIEITEEFITRNKQLMFFLATALARAAIETEGAVDADIRACLDSLIRTFRTRQSGLIYETRPDNAIAGQIQQRLQEAIDKLREALARESGLTTLRDMDVLGVLVFWQRLASTYDNNRPRGRAFLSFLLREIPAHAPPPEAPTIVAP